MKKMIEFIAGNGAYATCVFVSDDDMDCRLYSENGFIWLPDDFLRQLYEMLKSEIEPAIEFPKNEILYRKFDCQNRNEILYRRFDNEPDELDEDDMPF
jgi:hypothetical protein